MCLMYDTSSPVYSSAPNICCRAALSAACACLRAEGCETPLGPFVAVRAGHFTRQKLPARGDHYTRRRGARHHPRPVPHTHAPPHTHDRPRAARPPRRQHTAAAAIFFVSASSLCSSARPLHCPVAACEQVQATQEQQSIRSKLKKKRDAESGAGGAVGRRAHARYCGSNGRAAGLAAALLRCRRSATTGASAHL